MSNKKVGVSSKTPFKHWLLNAELGRQCAVLALNNKSVPCYADPLIIVDLCAGDGTTTEFSKLNSPSIINKHAEYLRSKHKQVDCFFIEKDKQTFLSLKENTNGMNAKLLNQDARDFYLEEIHNKQAVFINCDPNSVNDIPLTDKFMNSLNRYTTMVVTLGCNVCGIKRLKKERRSQWYDYINYMIKTLDKYHDLILCSVNKDASQWAYLIRLPYVWTGISINMYKKKGDNLFDNGVSAFSFYNHQNEFENKVHELFLTKKEIANGNF